MSDTPVNGQKAETRRLSEEELRDRYEALRRRSALSMTYARHRDPEKVVRWARDNAQDISLHKYQGFEFAKDNPKKPESERSIETVVGISEDGLYRVGDVILMVIDRYVYEYYQQENARHSVNAIAAGKENFKANMARIDVPTYSRDKAGRPI